MRYNILTPDCLARGGRRGAARGLMETTHRIIVELAFTRRRALALLTLGFLCWRPAILGSETLTMTTYYPAPYGGYARILTTNQALLARDAGNVGIGTGNPHGGASPHGPGRLHVNGGIFLEGSRTINTDGRMHIFGAELLYLLNRNGVVVSNAWGGNGNLRVDGRLQNLCTRRPYGYSHVSYCAGGEFVYAAYGDGAHRQTLWSASPGGTGAQGYLAIGHDWAGQMACCRIAQPW